MRKFIVYILTSDINSQNVKDLSDVFDYKHFIVKYLTTTNYQESVINRRDIRNESKTEIKNKYYNKNILNRIIKSLTRSYDDYPDGYTIILKDTSICNINKDNLYDIMKNTRKHQDWDICYLCKWLDRCDLYEDIKSCDYGIDLVRTFSPHGIKSLMFSPSGRNRILGIQPMRNGSYFTPIKSSLDDKLNKSIEKEDLLAVTYNSNIFIYNPLNLKSNKDVIKFSICRPKPHEHTGNAYDISMYVTVLAISVLILISFHLIKKNI